jgi:hypothetical protein
MQQDGLSLGNPAHLRYLSLRSDSNLQRPQTRRDLPSAPRRTAMRISGQLPHDCLEKPVSLAHMEDEVLQM